MFSRFVLKQLLLPPGIFLVLLLAGWWLRRRWPRLAGA
ncbi:MAG: YdcF family protein, partial [Proteobacteria bacterium]